MTHLEKQGIAAGASEEDYMHKAGLEIAKAVDQLCEQKKATLLVGKGNNGGDAYTAGHCLLDMGWEVEAIEPDQNLSLLSEKNKKKFLKRGGKLTKAIPDKGILLDGLFGTGFHGKPREPFATLIREANSSGLPIFAIDLPSGLNGDTGAVEGEAIRAAHTLFLQLPKKGFFLQEGWNHVGKLIPIDFGLDQAIIDRLENDMILTTLPMGKKLLPPIIADRHKYQAGVVAALAGSPGMPGAALLACLGALRSGAGLVRLLHPKGMEAELAASPYELIRVGYEGAEKIQELFKQSAAVLLGPGLGQSKTTLKLLQQVLVDLQKPAVIDADAITLIGEQNLKIPKEVILTPHVGEMMRLLPHSSPKPHTSEFLHTCQHFSEKHKTTLVLKGGPTFIFHPGEPIAVSPFGDPGMATAGSGDVLTGILAAFLAQKLAPRQAAILGVMLHGIAGEIAASRHGSYSMIAGDLVSALGEGFAKIS